MHAQDVQSLLALLQRLVEKGNTVVIIEHRLELIAAADWIIDLGPGSGEQGGQILFEGTPQQLLKCPDSATAKYLKRS